MDKTWAQDLTDRLLARAARESLAAWARGSYGDYYHCNMSTYASAVATWDAAVDVAMAARLPLAGFSFQVAEALVFAFAAFRERATLAVAA